MQSTASERRSGERPTVAMVTSLPVHRDLMLLQTEDEVAAEDGFEAWERERNLWPQALTHHHHPLSPSVNLPEAVTSLLLHLEGFSDVCAAASAALSTSHNAELFFFFF